jgi:hypothetical protein
MFHLQQNEIPKASLYFKELDEKIKPLFELTDFLFGAPDDTDIRLASCRPNCFQSSSAS